MRRNSTFNASCSYYKALFFLSLLIVYFILKKCQQQQPRYTDDSLLSDCSNETNYVEEFDLSKDVFALIDIQGTGAAEWEMHMFKHLQIKFEENFWMPICVMGATSARYTCYRNQQKSIMWDRAAATVFCDAHADYTELKNCVMTLYRNRIRSEDLFPSFDGVVYFITFLSDPVNRYVDEYESVKRKESVNWADSVRQCLDQKLYKHRCSSGHGVSWESFLGCKHNLANNRQVRMLANYNILGCNVLQCWSGSSNCTAKEKEFYNKKLLQSAKHTLIALPFFGLTEFPEESEYLFLKTFNNQGQFKFTHSFSYSAAAKTNYPKRYINEIKINNNLDLQLYEYAKLIFFKRYVQFKMNEIP